MVKSKRSVKIVNRVSPLLWLLPLFFVVVGGIIAWGLAKGIDKKKAEYMLLFGIVWTFVGIGLLYIF